ncbi:uncharacterized protein B0H18DRAFT_955045 [Fomitopsis serialis]|uniref:uncharacterized protein n=1 Tax=Fomitopsis serialis TaxID=139415 RepID=UPI002008A958|nr:uncharacterized protein B0H18DRAFT_955045 [Neoantrodia serialis]KAH9925519.1 hypothetical protein B0H18DRAFT_955045 [Neoantrodia serialis]
MNKIWLVQVKHRKNKRHRQHNWDRIAIHGPLPSKSSVVRHSWAGVVVSTSGASQSRICAGNSGTSAWDFSSRGKPCVLRRPLTLLLSASTSSQSLTALLLALTSSKWPASTTVTWLRNLPDDSCPAARYCQIFGRKITVQQGQDHSSIPRNAPDGIQMTIASAASTTPHKCSTRTCRSLKTLVSTSLTTLDWNDSHARIRERMAEPDTPTSGHGHLAQQPHTLVAAARNEDNSIDHCTDSRLWLLTLRKDVWDRLTMLQKPCSETSIEQVVAERLLGHFEVVKAWEGGVGEGERHEGNEAGEQTCKEVVGTSDESRRTVELECEGMNGEGEEYARPVRAPGEAVKVHNKHVKKEKKVAKKVANVTAAALTYVMKKGILLPYTVDPSSDGPIADTEKQVGFIDWVRGVTHLAVCDWLQHVLLMLVDSWGALQAMTAVMLLNPHDKEAGRPRL